MNAIQKASDVLGSQRALSDALNVTPATVNQWVSGARPIPVERCPAIEMATEGEVTRRDLRPTDWWMIWPELVTDDFPAPVAVDPENHLKTEPTSEAA
jgi:DNA-binding transcriptional regulator YdaS (Cro superfamily)